MWKYENAKKLIEEQGRTRAWVAKEIGVDPKSLNNILAGRKPSLPVIKLMARLFSVPETLLYEPDKGTQEVS